ncbi:hypothetical protein AAY473_034187 [Plecturocebus cupreus]
MFALKTVGELVCGTVERHQRAEGRRGQQGKECLGDEATVELVQLLLGQHQPVSLSKTSRTREETRSCYTAQDSLKLLAISDPPTLAFRSTGITGMRHCPRHTSHLNCIL